MMFIFVFLLLIGGNAHASDVPRTKDVAAWNACHDATVRSDEAKELEDVAGRTAVVELVYKSCGFRPVFVSRNGRLALDDDDCAELFRWSSNRVCVPEDTVALDLLTRVFDPRVFDRKKYRDRCDHYLEVGHTDSYRAFRKDICEVKRR
jgi:hypothetical protein